MKDLIHSVPDHKDKKHKDQFGIDYIYDIKQIQASSLSDDLIEEDTRRIMFQGIQYDLMHHNYQTLLPKYIQYFNTKPLRKKTIKKGEIFFRGRLGKKVVKGIDNNLNEEFIVPFHCEDIGTAPHLFVKGGRFNREGVAYLYLASDVKTCLSEVHIQVGQECSVAKFIAVKDIILLNLVEKSTDLEMRIWYEILTQPVYEDIKYKYLITQFLADIFSRKFENGIYFNSSQGKGHNIVSFHPEQFSLVPYSERLYSAHSISIKEVVVADCADELTKSIPALHEYHDAENTCRQKEFAYLKKLIQHRRQAKTEQQVTHTQS